MPVRMPVVAGAFYPAAPVACRHEVELCLQGVTQSIHDKTILAGIVPHAGWVYSGTTAAYVFAAIAKQKHPEAVVLLGAVHRWGVDGPSLYPEGSWRTPLGDAVIDTELGQAIFDEASGQIAKSSAAHEEEHSIEVQLPFIKYLMPESRIVPIAVPPEANALPLGEQIARAIIKLGRRVIVIASSDLTHYGPRYGYAPAGVGQLGLDWSRHNDAQLLALAQNLKAKELLSTADRQRSACGAGAIAAAITFSAAFGATQGELLHYTTSYDAMPSERPRDLVGYGAMIFV
jgi:AmmeMemoRadiSam system protein B